MKKVSIIRKLASRILKEYSNIFSILSSWKYESRLSYFRTRYQQRENCFGEQSKELEKEWKNGIDELNGTFRDLLLKENFKKLFHCSFEL